MWGKRLLGVIGAAYLGGLISTVLGDGVIYQSSNLLFYVKFSFFLLAFTIPGTLVVLVVYELTRKAASGFLSYAVSAIGGAAIGGLMTWAMSTGRAEAFAVGAYYGLITALIWAVIDRRWATVA
jgi:hypothetical protein